MIGSQVSKAQCDKILNYINIGKEEGAVVLAGGEAGNHEETLWRILYSTNSVERNK
jgi:aldehyde dehydrogenase (NAD+)/aldehyde dehydrogenase